MDTTQADEIERIVDARMSKFLVKFAQAFEGYHTPSSVEILAILEDLRYSNSKDKNNVDYSGFDSVLNWNTDKEFIFRKNGTKADPQDLTQVNPHLLGGMVRQISEDELVLDDLIINTEDTSTPREYSQTALRVQELAGLFETEEESYGWGIKSTLI